MLMMLPFEAPTIFEGIHKSYFRMPRVVKDQRSKFENDDLFRQLSHESAVKYTGFKERPLEERQMKFIANCQEGHTEVSVVQSGNQFTLMFNPTINPAYNNEGCDFDKELGKVHIKAGFILNGVCVFWRGWIDLQRLEGFGSVEFDEYRAYLEEAMLKQQLDKQQMCNNSANSHQPLARLNPLAGPPHLSGAQASLPAPPSTMAGALPPVGLNGPPAGPPGCLAGPLPAVSLADSAAHYGNAAIAAAAAAAFHQALGVGPPQPGQTLHGLSGSGPPAALSAAAAAAAAAAASNGHLPYTTAMGAGQPPAAAKLQRTSSTSPPSSQLNGLNGSPGAARSPPTARQAIKRAASDDEQTNVDDVDVVSDIHAHDLDFPPRRIFKSANLAAHHHHHHHHPSHHHHRATRRA